jgi:hypothetical protein
LACSGFKSTPGGCRTLPPFSGRQSGCRFYAISSFGWMSSDAAIAPIDPWLRRRVGCSSQKGIP